MHSTGGTRRRRARAGRPALEVFDKRILDQRVAELLGVPARDIANVTDAFLHEVFTALLEGHAVRLDGVGTMHVQVTEMISPVRMADIDVLRKYYVKFKKGRRLREAIKAKYGTNTRRTDNGQVRS